VVTTILSRS